MRALQILYTVIALPIAVVATVVFAVLAMVIALFGRHGRLALEAVRLWARICLGIGGIILHVEGVEGIDLDQRYIVMSNHESSVDIPALLAALPPRLKVRFLAKKQLFKIPFLGWAMRAVGFVPVDRADRSTAAGMFRAAVNETQQGSSLLVFPEETRTRDGRLLELQRGGFLLALRSGFPILPVGLEGARVALPAKSWLLRPGTRVAVRFGGPIPTAGLATAQRRQLTATTRREIDRLRGLRGHIPDAERPEESAAAGSGSG
ncbi:MAG: 1-acyl-sn-glycerol-3-phosphate acyltransferase [Acidobacteria bacterium]|jgi:1-acyl-sn-glycerol-3-phosphate acyltransferase|nr:1-acyl-sn-glycerol-3-phosphate acyltransferase [Acidobacteriota bacterium]